MAQLKFRGIGDCGIVDLCLDRRNDYNVKFFDNFKCVKYLINQEMLDMKIVNYYLNKFK